MHPTPQRLAVLKVTSVRRVSFVTPFIVVDIKDPPPPSHGFLKAFFLWPKVAAVCASGEM